MIFGSNSLYISGCVTILIFCLMCASNNLFFVCSRSALLGTITHIFKSILAFTVSIIILDFPYDVGATIETVESLCSFKNISIIVCSYVK